MAAQAATVTSVSPHVKQIAVNTRGKFVPRYHSVIPTQVCQASNSVTSVTHPHCECASDSKMGTGVVAPGPQGQSPCYMSPHLLATIRSLTTDEALIWASEVAPACRMIVSNSPCKILSTAATPGSPNAARPQQ